MDAVHVSGSRNCEHSAPCSQRCQFASHRLVYCAQFPRVQAVALPMVLAVASVSASVVPKCSWKHCRFEPGHGYQLLQRFVEKGVLCRCKQCAGSVAVRFSSDATTNGTVCCSLLGLGFDGIGLL